MNTQGILKKSQSDKPLPHEELVYLLDLPIDAPENYLVMAEVHT